MTFCCIALCHECEEEVVQLLHLLNICQLVCLKLQTLHTTPRKFKGSADSEDAWKWDQSARVCQESFVWKPTRLGCISMEFYLKSLQSLAANKIKGFTSLEEPAKRTAFEIKLNHRLTMDEPQHPSA